MKIEPPSPATKLLPLFIIILLEIQFYPVNGQILLKPDPNIDLDRMKGIIMLHSTLKGSFLLDDYFMTKLNGKDTVYLVNIQSGKHSAGFVTEKDTLTRNFTVNSWKVEEVIPGRDSIRVRNNAFNFNDTREKVTGKPLLFREKTLFNITHFTLFAAPVSDAARGDVDKWFRTITTITGLQVTPGFSMGLGISYSNCDIPQHYEYYYMDDSGSKRLEEDRNLSNVSFLPIFYDIRIHFSGKRVAPFLKFDIGYNILLSKKSMIIYESYYYDDITLNTFEMIKGRGYVSPGAGFRIAVNRQIQIIVSVDYSAEFSKSQYKYSDSPFYDDIRKTSLQYFKFNIGVGYQK